jgi:hypothetical protein
MERMTLRRSTFLLACCGALLVSCKIQVSEPVKETKEEAPKEPVGGRYAFHQAYVTARTWSQDLQILRINDIKVGDVNAEPGKAAAWEITLVSPSSGKQRSYTYSIVEQGSIHEGVFAGLEQTYAQRGQASPFLIQALKVDTVEAYATAAAQSKEYMAKNPDIPITFVLEKTPRHPNPTWRVIWGTSVGTSNYSVYVDATTGQFLERMR